MLDKPILPWASSKAVEVCYNRRSEESKLAAHLEEYQLLQGTQIR